MSAVAATLADVREMLTECAAAQEKATADWHEAEPGLADSSPAGPREAFSALVLAQHLANFRLWHVEDEARRTDVGPEVIADCKRRIDRLNQERNDLIEKVDAALIGLMAPLLPANASERRNTETVGMAVDRLSILALKVFHMAEQTRRTDADQAHREACAAKLDVLLEQRADLLAAIVDLVAEYAAGTKRPKVYFQFKMYNDPALNPALYGAAKK